MIELEPDPVRVLEQDRIISGRPLILARRADDIHAERRQKRMQLVDVGALAGAEAEMMQADALLFEGCALMLERRRADPDGGAAADAIIRRLGVDDGFQPEERNSLR